MALPPYKVEWIEGEPPPGRKPGTPKGYKRTHNLAITIGILMSQPGKWARLPEMDERVVASSASSVQKILTGAGLQAAIHDGKVYARYVG